jgi:hypothetical protein
MYLAMSGIDFLINATLGLYVLKKAQAILADMTKMNSLNGKISDILMLTNMAR